MAGGGKSSSQSTQQTTNEDKRVVADSGAVGVSGTGNSIQVLDAGAVGKAIDLATNVNASRGQDLATELGFAGDVFTKGLGVLDKAGQQINAQTQLLSQAYDNAQGAGDQKTLLTVAGLAVVAVVAIKVLK